MQPTNSIDKLVDHLFRTEAGRITALLTRIFGLKQIETAEDIVQETLIDALNQWSVGDIPSNPSAWILQAAKYKAINLLKREQRAMEYAQSERHLRMMEIDKWEDLFQEEFIGDSQLRMIFACCHPRLPIESQIALTLKTLCGLSVPEIAHALVTTVSNINKRLYRAKQKFRKEEIAFTLPQKSELPHRLEAVYLALYLLFNEGYNSSHHDELIREDLCVDAIRLSALLAHYYENQPKAWALLSLMYFHAARFDARLDSNGGIIIFEDQDRSKWDLDMIRTGIHFLNKSAAGEELSAYHFEAGIAAEHCLASSFESTNWQNIFRQYQLLYAIKPNPVIELNLAIISSRIDGIDASIEKLIVIERTGALENYYLLASTLGHFYFEKGMHSKALQYFEKALSLTRSPVEMRLLKEKIERCKRGG